MKRIARSIRRGFSSTTLYYDDLQDIVKAAFEVGDGIRIQAGEYEIDNPSQLDQLAANQSSDRFGEITIYTHAHNIQIYIWTHTIAIHAWAENQQFHALSSIVESIVKRGRKRYFLLVCLSPILAVLSAGVIGAILLSEPLMLLSALAFSAALYIPVFDYYMKHSVIVHTRKRRDRLSFWLRKRDEIILGIIVAAISAFFTFVITHLLS